MLDSSVFLSPISMMESYLNSVVLYFFLVTLFAAPTVEAAAGTAVAIVLGTSCSRAHSVM